MRIAALAGDRVDRLDVVGPVAAQELGRHRDDVGLAHPGLELLADQVIGAVHHGGGAVEERDLVDALDLARLQHDLLAVDHLEGLLQFEQHQRLDDVEPSCPALCSLVPGIHVLRATSKACTRANNTTARATTSPGAWMAETSPAVTC